MVAKRKSARRITPIPAVFHRDDTPSEVAAKPWTFGEGTGATELYGRTMEIPLDDSEESAGIRAHEMLHVALSPYSHEEMDFATLAAEDGRVETLATARGVVRPIPMTREEFRKTLDGASELLLPSLAVASTGAPGEPLVREWLDERGRSDIADLMDWAHGVYLSGDSHENTLRKVASRIRALASVTGNPAPPPPSAALFGHGKPKPTPTPENKPSEDAAAQEIASKGTRPSDGSPVPVPSMVLPVNPEDYTPLNPDDYATWGEMRIETPPLPEILSDARGSLRTRATDFGTVPRKLYRLPLDGKVFTSHKHKRQGTVLIDMSGSMSLDPDDVAELVRSAPAAVVAGYWGEDRMGPVRILANNGRMAETRFFYPEGGGNEIDGPALWWLSRQRAPRLWVSDGYISAADDAEPSQDMRKEVETILRRSRIRQIDPRILADWHKEVIKNLR